MAVSHLRYVVVDVTLFTVENEQIRPNFPVDFSPRDPVCFSYEGYKLLEVPGAINDMLGPNLAVMINI